MRFLDPKDKQEYFYITQELSRNVKRMDTNRMGARTLLKVVKITGYFEAYVHELRPAPSIGHITEVDTYLTIKKAHGYNY